VKSTERILILNVSGIGDFVDSTPSLHLARKLRPDAWITLAVSEKVFPLARSCPYVDDVVALPTSGGRNIPHWKDSIRWMRGARRLRGFTTAINLYAVATRAGAWWMRTLLAWSGAKTTIGSNTAGRAPFYSRHLTREAIPEDQIQRGLKVIGLLEEREPPAAPPAIELWIEEKIMAGVREWMQKQAGLTGPPVIVFLGGDRVSRHESPERAEAWLGAIQQRWNIHPILIGLATDPGLPRSTKLRHTDLRGQWTIEQSAALISCGAALITTHSAPQHFASVWQTPTVVLVGPGDFRRYRPHMDPEKLRMLRNPVDCSPCYFMQCPLQGADHQKCLTGITVESIVQAFGEVFRITTTR
jgi:ADP-heptose:LPS heptosyltransferase